MQEPLQLVQILSLRPPIREPLRPTHLEPSAVLGRCRAVEHPCLGRHRADAPRGGRSEGRRMARAVDVDEAPRQWVDDVDADEPLRVEERRTAYLYSYGLYRYGL